MANDDGFLRRHFIGGAALALGGLRSTKLTAQARTTPPVADLLIVNAKIHTMDAANRIFPASSTSERPWLYCGRK